MLTAAAAVVTPDCERVRESFLVQPTLAASSLALVAAGAWLLWRGRHLSGTERFAASVYAVLIALAGIGSVDFHGPQTAASQVLHDAPIAALTIWVVAVPLARVIQRRPILPHPSPKLLFSTAVVAVVAVTAYWLGRTSSPWCNPDSWAQAHALWHLLIAVTLTLVGSVLWPTRTGRTQPAGTAASSSAPTFGSAGAER